MINETSVSDILYRFNTCLYIFSIDNDDDDTWTMLYISIRKLSLNRKEKRIFFTDG